MPDLNILTPENIRSCLLQCSGITHDLPGHWTEIECQQAAVLIPFVQIQQQWHLLYIRRTAHPDDPHSGQVAFAGGKYELVDENLTTTALREAQEEIGLMPQDVKVLGKLNYHHSISRFRITPVVAQVPWPYALTLDQQEVARVFTIPLNWLANSENYCIRQHQHEQLQPFPVVYFDEYDGELLWGATARMTLSLISLLKQ
ncbi:MAG: CoA pyrophosphatase [Gammaproteobacteria bacterium]|nr:CoA pyrophosphatase [Gammaproteobacteria bacterium]